MAEKLTKADVQEIFAILDSSDFDELHIETEGLKLTARRKGAVPSQPPAESQKPVAVTTPNIKAEQTQAAIAAPASLASGDIINVPAPMLGIFYSAPKPGAEPFVTPGMKIGPETVVGIIEVMKLMNPVTSGLSGIAVEIAVADGTMVEFGQTILRLRPE